MITIYIKFFNKFYNLPSSTETMTVLTLPILLLYMQGKWQQTTTNI